jgi:excisionase family DNA binding protein
VRFASQVGKQICLLELHDMDAQRVIERIDTLTVAELATMLRCRTETIYRLMKRRVLPGFKVGNHWRFSQREIEDWMLSQTRLSSTREAVRSRRKAWA